MEFAELVMKRRTVRRFEDARNAYGRAIQARPNYRAIHDFINPGYIALFDQHGPKAWKKARAILGG